MTLHSVGAAAFETAFGRLIAAVCLATTEPLTCVFGRFVGLTTSLPSVTVGLAVGAATGATVLTATSTTVSKPLSLIHI